MLLEAVETNWISFLLIILFIFLYLFFALFAQSCLCGKVFLCGITAEE
jgi:hypothetical protein